MAWEQRYAELEAMVADACASMKQMGQRINQRIDDQSTYDWRFGGDDRRFGGDDRRFGGGQFREGADDDDETYGISAKFREYLMLRNDDDDETWTWTEHYSVMDDETDLLEEESLPQFQVPVSDLEHGLRFHNASSIVSEDSQYVVGCDELCDHQKSISQVSHVKEMEEFSLQSTNGDGEHVAHQLFDQKPVRVTHKEKHMKHLKAWKFKFKPTSKRSRLMADKFSLVDATVLLNKDLQEIIWDCVNKEFKETMAACEKNRVDQFKLAEEKESKLQVLDLHQTFMYHLIGRVWEPGGLPNKRDLWDWIETELKACGESQQVERFLYSLMQVVKRDLEFKTFSDFDIALFIGLEICGFETKKHVSLLMKPANRVWECGELLAIHVYHKWLEKKKLRNVEDGVKQDKNRFSGDVGAKVFMASEELHLLQDVFEMVKELLLKTSWVSPQVMRNTKLKFTKQWMFKFRKKKIDEWLGYSLIVAYLRNKKTLKFKYKAPNLDTKVFETSDQCVRKRVLVSDDHETEDNQLILRFLMWVIQNCLHHYMVLLLASVAYDAQFSIGVGMNKKQPRLSLQVWDPGGWISGISRFC